MNKPIKRLQRALIRKTLFQERIMFFQILCMLV